MSNAKKYLVGFIILLIIDLVWLMLFMGKRFGNMVFKIQGQEMKLNPIAALVSYVLLGIGLVHFGINRVDPNNPIMSSIVNGGLFGLLSYGIFDFTNLAIFSNYELSTAIIDTMWGGVLFSVATYFSHMMLLYIK